MRCGYEEKDPRGPCPPCIRANKECSRGVSSHNLGLEESRAPKLSFPGAEDLASDLNGFSTQSHNRQEDIYKFINSFGVGDVSFGNRSARDPFSQSSDAAADPLSDSGTCQ